MSTSHPRTEAHRIARVNYPPRALSFIGAFVAILLLARELDFGLGVLLFAAATFLVYPHLAFLHAIRASDSKRAELANLLIDSILLGAWVALASFNLWLSFAFLSATLINNAVVGGTRQLLLASGAFLVAILLVTIITEVGFEPTASLGTTLYIATLALVYLIAVGITAHTLNAWLIQAHQNLVRNSRVFSSLLGLTTISNQSTDLGNLIDQALDHFRELEPDHPFALLLFERERPRQLRKSGFRGISHADQEMVLDRLTDHHESDQRQRELKTGSTNGQLLALPIGGQLERAGGYVVTSAELTQELGKLLPLYLDQLAAALQNKLLTEYLLRAAETDALTGLYNRRYFEQQLHDAIERKHRHKRQDFSIVMLDLVGLKRVNDSLGHAAGDQLITTIAERLRRSARSVDVVARIGGDEFVVLCHGCIEADALNLADRLIEACRHPVKLDQGATTDIDTQATEISAGVAGSDYLPPEEVMKVADARMYEHKAAYYRQTAGQR
jgi:diguanylate cyclase (GGDEF)-like protein